MDHLISNTVRQQCFTVVESARHVVDVDFSAIPRFVAENLQLDQVKELKSRFQEKNQVPFTFDSIEHEVNFTALSCLLAFGSGYRKELHAENNKGAADTMMYGLIAMYFENHSLDAEFLNGLSVYDISKFFDLPLSAQEPISPAVYKTVPHQLAPFVTNIHQILSETGSILLGIGCPSFHSFFVKVAEEMQNDIRTMLLDESDSGDIANDHIPISSQYILKRLIDTFPGFSDQADVIVPPPTAGEYKLFYQETNMDDDGDEDEDEDEFEDEENPSLSNDDKSIAVAQEPPQTFSVSLYKKAQLLVSELHFKFSQRLPEVYMYYDIESVTIFADNVIPAMFTSLNFIKPCSRVQEMINSGKSISKSSAYILRAASVVISEVLLFCVNAEPHQLEKIHEMLSQVSHPMTGDELEMLLEQVTLWRNKHTTTHVSASEVDFLFYTLGKRPDLRKIERHCLKQTLAY